jgi:hypothetical protein
VTVDAAAGHAAPRVLAERYRRLRAAHPVSVLAWLRNGVLLCVLATALLYLWVAIQAGNDIAAANRTQQGIKDIGQAISATRIANGALQRAFNDEDVTLTGTGSYYVNEIALVSKYLTLAAEDNAAGQDGTSAIQYAQDELQAYLQGSEDAVLDYSVNEQFGKIAANDYASNSEGDMTSALDNLKGIEEKARAAQRGAWPVDPGVFWWALLGPVIGILVLIVATVHVLARHFRRRASRWLCGSLLVTAATAVTGGLFNTSDERHVSADPWAGHPGTLTCALLLFLLAGVLAHLAYRPRLAEYRFESA